jgi:hypothetical protein
VPAVAPKFRRRLNTWESDELSRLTGRGSCALATSAEEHANAIKYDYPMFSKPMTGTEFIATLARRGLDRRHLARLVTSCAGPTIS